MANSDLVQCAHLSDQAIDENGPGSILQDFETLLDFVGEGVPSSGKNRLLPMARLFELDARMTKPLRPGLERPQQKSFPHINGLHLMLRATQLGIVEVSEKAGGQLVLDPAMLEQWHGLNATERYFNLFEAWLRHSRWEMVGLRNSRWASDIALQARELWSAIPASGRRFSEKQSLGGELVHSVERSCTLALLELFGLMTVEHGRPHSRQSWQVAGVHHTPFGDELLGVVFGEIERNLLHFHEPVDEFGVWRSLLQPYFPQWQNNLDPPDPAFRDGVHYFKVSLGPPWRRIAMPAESDLDDLAQWIIGAFDFDGDHLYGFQLTARDGRQLRAEHPYVDDAEMHTDDMPIGHLPLIERDSMVFEYDYGANWRFKVQLEKVEADNAEITEPTIVESRGKAPSEYGDEDEDEDW